MKISRRTFAKFLGMTSLSAPLAAKAATDAEVAKLAGVAIDGAPALQYTPSYPPSSIGMDDYNKARITAADYARVVGVPEFVKEQIRRDSQYVSCLDPDLAAKRSWSMSVKIATQRERNYARYLERLHYSGWHAHSMLAFKKITGWDWPW